jgi:hypothetical protein
LSTKFVELTNTHGRKRQRRGRITRGSSQKRSHDGKVLGEAGATSGHVGEEQVPSPQGRDKEEEEQREAERIRWTRKGEKPWDDEVPHACDQPDRAGVVVSFATKEKIWAGGYVNLANFLDLSEEERTVE